MATHERGEGDSVALRGADHLGRVVGAGGVA
jgi:hypothetical protein